MLLTPTQHREWDQPEAVDQGMSIAHLVALSIDTGAEQPSRRRLTAELPLYRTRGDVPITPTDRFNRRPNSAKGRDCTPEEWKQAARLVYDGTEGRVDAAPGPLACLFQQYGGRQAGMVAQGLQRRATSRS